MPHAFRRLPGSGVALAIGFLALGLFLMASVLFTVRQQGDDALLRQALEVEVDLGDLQVALLDAEVGQRGYLLTRDAEFLTPYRTASDRLDQLLDRLGNAVRTDVDQDAVFRQIASLVRDKRAELARTLSLEATGDVAGAVGLVRGKTGMALMDGIRQLILTMDREQDRRVAERQRAMQQIGLATSVTTAISLLLMGLVALAALAEVRKRARLARFLPPEVATRLADDDHGLRTGRSGPATVAFIDIRDSTALAETLAPTAVSALLTTFREMVSAAAGRHRGMVDKFIGDGALVVFGALDGDPRSPEAALAFAEDLLGLLSATGQDGARLRVGIGLHHGEVFCGIVGGDERQEFTVLGDTVNVASRIETATKRFGTDLLVSEAVLAAADVDRCGWRQVSQEPLRGRQESTALYARNSVR